tara:strand:- start:104 stop:2311 length:2208 start_codon:yes stop_codon:yes gene_type:complete
MSKTFEEMRKGNVDEISIKDLTKKVAQSTGTQGIQKAMGKSKDKTIADLAAMRKRLNAGVEHGDTSNHPVNEYLTAAEKKLMAQMYDKKGNLTPLGKKVMDHGKKNEELDEAISPAMIGKLKKQYSTTGERISTDAAMKMSAMVKKFGDEELVQLAKADIKWISTSAITALIIKGKGSLLKESVELSEAMKLTHALIDTADGNKVKAVASSEQGIKQSMRSADRPPMSVKSKNTLKIVTLTKPISQKASEKMVGYPLPKGMDKFPTNTSATQGKMMGEHLDEAKASYEIYHKDFSGAMQHAYASAKKNYGITVKSSEIDDKVASGPRKPSNGKTNTYRLKGDKGSIQVQVYNTGSKYELNMYKESLDEAMGSFEYYYADGTGVVSAVGNKGDMRKMSMKQAKAGQKGGNFSQNNKKYKVGDKIKEDLDEVSRSTVRTHFSARYNDKEVKMGIGIASNKKYANNMTGASKAIEKIKKGLSDHPQIKAVLKRMNENELTFEQMRMKSVVREISPDLYNKAVAGRKDKQDSAANSSAANSMRGNSAGAAKDKETSNKHGMKLAKMKAMGVNRAASSLRKESVEEAKSPEGTIRIIDLARQNNPEVRKHLNVAKAGNKGYQVQRMTKGVFTNQGKPYKSSKEAEKVRKTGQHSMQMEAAPKIDPQKMAAHMARNNKPKKMTNTQKQLSSIRQRADKMAREDFTPHMMYDPKTGEAHKAEKEEDHLRMKKMGYTHDKPES